MIDNVPEYELTDEQREFRQDLKRLVDDELKPIDFNEYEWRDDPTNRIPWEVVERIDRELDLRALTVPEEYGGLDADPLTVTIAAEELARGDMGIAVIFDQTWKFIRIIDGMATGDLRDDFFNEFMDDPRYVLAATMTEPDHGSNNLLPNVDHVLNTTAKRDGDEWVINGLKRYISNGADAKTYLIFAQSDTSVPATQGTTLFMVPQRFDGLEVSHIHEKISQRLINNATVEFNDLRVPHDRVLGEVHGGMKAVGELLKESHTEAAATTLGTARRAFEDAFEHAAGRDQGGQEIIEHQAIGHDFADMAAQLQSARSLIWSVARSIESGQYTEDLGSMAKMHAAEVSFDVCKRSLEKFGGGGIMLETPQQKYLRDALSFLHSDGTQEVHKEKIILALKERAGI